MVIDRQMPCNVLPAITSLTYELCYYFCVSFHHTCAFLVLDYYLPPLIQALMWGLFSLEKEKGNDGKVLMLYSLGVMAEGQILNKCYTCVLLSHRLGQYLLL